MTGVVDADKSGQRWVDVESLYLDLALPEGRDGRPYVAVNMVTTADGKAVVAGKAGKIGSPLDRTMMSRIRAATDCVLVGAGTVRAELVSVRVRPEEEAARLRRGWTPQPLGAIVTNTGDLPLGRPVFADREPRPLVFTGDDAVSRHSERFEALGRVARILTVGREAPDIRLVLSTLAQDFGVRRLLVEGGPALNQALFDLGLVDELFLTLAPRVVGGRSKTIVEDADAEPRLDLARVRLISIAEAASELFLRYRVVRPSDS